MVVCNTLSVIIQSKTGLVAALFLYYRIRGSKAQFSVLNDACKELCRKVVRQPLRS